MSCTDNHQYRGTHTDDRPNDSPFVYKTTIQRQRSYNYDKTHESEEEDYI